ncbi:unnamed protein product [Rotaria socialis]|uniref:Uncharacterized protein n=1 Tax=Rotaria socialis TaxID=392032 RepID=A0A817YMQ2_9BILA|nr:unnamed protein product [Rotaria socialis]
MNYDTVVFPKSDVKEIWKKYNDGNQFAIILVVLFDNFYVLFKLDEFLYLQNLQIHYIFKFKEVENAQKHFNPYVKTSKEWCFVVSLWSEVLLEFNHLQKILIVY